MSDPNVDLLAAQMLRRAEVGLLKYGVDTTRTDLRPRDWNQHMIEELLDAAVYAQALQSRLIALEAFAHLVVSYYPRHGLPVPERLRDGVEYIQTILGETDAW